MISNEQNKHSANEKNEMQRMKLIKLIRARSEHTMFSDGILDMEFVYNDDFVLHLFTNDKIINPPNIKPQC